jgi:hypothetical protein
MAVIDVTHHRGERMALQKRPVVTKKTFSNDGAAEAWCEAEGLSVGTPAGGRRVG